MIETVDDIVEELADKIGVYGLERSYWTGSMKRRIRQAVRVELTLDGTIPAKIDGISGVASEGHGE